MEDFKAKLVSSTDYPKPLQDYLISLMERVSVELHTLESFVPFSLNIVID